MIKTKDIVITTDMLNKITEIDQFIGSWSVNELKLSPAELKSMKRVATIESVGSSNRIEGNKLSDAEVEELFSHINKKSFASRDEEEVAGYSDLINTIFDTNRGAAYDAAGREIGTIFETASPFDTPRLMRELIQWTNDTLVDRFLHPVITIGVFIVQFLSIHPFADGNGRLSRALTILLMLKSKYSYMPYASMESVIENNKDAYYRALRNTQKTIWSDKVDYEPWLTFFVTSLQKQKRSLEEKIRNLQKANADKLSSTAHEILALFAEKTALTMPEIVQKSGKNAETIRKSVQNLVKKGFLTKSGTTRGAFYTVRK